MSLGVLIALKFPMSFFMVCCLVQFPTKIPEMLRKFAAYQDKYGLKIDMKKWTKTVNYVSIYMMLSLSVSTPMYIFFFQSGIFSEKSVFSNLIFYFNISQNEYFKLFVMLLTVIKGLLLTYFYYCYYFLFFIMCRILISEYHGLNKELKEFIQTYNDDKCYPEELETVESFRKQHVAVTALTHTTNDVIRHMAGMQYGMTLPMLCLTLYGIVHGRIEVEDSYILR
ncbi:hypothetical protein FSP39_012410 [Pinctada imbricata]|uniref:Uncharacterized protein n=1 Tax=Pinctada imbricata TaxID=66713 RepID=A0AA89BJC7_PINIB|nr:hypothetical protein FSP39_012410 [Pinctada imbricata]